MSYFIAFCISTVYIFLKACQQVNVIHGYYARVPLVSIGMAFCEAVMVLLVVKNFYIFLPIGIGGAIGCICAMRVNKIGANSGASNESKN